MASFCILFYNLKNSVVIQKKMDYTIMGKRGKYIIGDKVMRRLHKAVTFLLIVLCVAGAAFSYQFLKKEQKRATMRQQEISEVSKQLEPINQKRREWEKKDKEWQATLAEKQTGRTCVLLGFDNMSRELYDTIFDLMDQYGFRGTFAMRNGKMPSWEAEKSDEYTSSEMIQEMLDAGWDYAVSVGEDPVDGEEETAQYRPDFSDEFGDIVSESETEMVQENFPDETERQEDETEAQGFLSELEAAVTTLSENGYTLPETLFCTAEQYKEATDKNLSDYGFTMVSVTDPENHPAIDQKKNEENDSKLWVIDTGIYTQRDEQMEKQIDGIVAKQQSVAISINEIVKISKDIDYDLNLTTFTSLLNYLKELESDRKINVLTYSEYYQYEQLREESYKTALAEYAAFREEMLAALEELDIEEGQIAKQLNETETVSVSEQGE